MEIEETLFNELEKLKIFQKMEKKLTEENIKN